MLVSNPKYLYMCYDIEWWTKFRNLLNRKNWNCEVLVIIAVWKILNVSHGTATLNKGTVKSEFFKGLGWAGMFTHFVPENSVCFKDTFPLCFLSNHLTGKLVLEITPINDHQVSPISYSYFVLFKSKSHRKKRQSLTHQSFLQPSLTFSETHFT